MENNYTVYMHIFPNKKVYIGITCRNPKYRWNNGKNYKTNEIMCRAINKYGWENIEHEILYKNLTKEEAEQKEIELIAEYNSTNKNYGYNIEKGGKCVGRVSDETKIKISKNNARYWKGKKMPEEARKKLSLSLKGRKMKRESILKGLETRKKNYPNGVQISIEVRKRRSDKMKNNKISAKEIIQLDKEGNFIKEWSCISDASRELKINNGSIVSCAKGRRKSAGEYIWVYKNEYLVSNAIFG